MTILIIKINGLLPGDDRIRIHICAVIIIT